jgi:hypothetical protein
MMSLVRHLFREHAPASRATSRSRASRTAPASRYVLEHVGSVALSGRLVVSIVSIGRRDW